MFLRLKLEFLVLNQSEIALSVFGSRGLFNRVVLTRLEVEDDDILV
jgi:hypothetical protein